MSDAWDPEDQAIARALGADQNAETEGADEQLVDSYREVLSHIPVAEVAPSTGLEDRVVAAALARRPASVPTLGAARDRRRRRARRIQMAVLAATIVAAAIVIGAIVHAGTAGSPAPKAHMSLATVHRDDIAALVRAPGTRTAVLGTLGRVALGRIGDGVVYQLGRTQPLSIGLVSDGGTTVIGPASPNGGTIAFVVDHPERVKAVELLRNGASVARGELTPG
ncbi:MAG TPA: hypothetical protein VL119_13190 [Acidimicrobiia bacterium]|nr:hypothetical protein [Acidimicrobiia bacterium]